MKTTIGAITAILAASTMASADMILHMDVNGIQAQAMGSNGIASSFGGLSHTGSVNFSFSSAFSVLAGMDIQTNGGTPVAQSFNGPLMNFTGGINMVNGMVTGGSLTVNVGSGDSYTAQITPNVGQVSNYIGGGYKIDGLTFNGHFNHSSFASVDVTPWFNAQALGGLLGSFLQFNFQPNQNGFAFADIDIFVNAQVIPLPPAGWAGLATLTGVMVAGYIRRRR